MYAAEEYPKHPVARFEALPSCKVCHKTNSAAPVFQTLMFVSFGIIVLSAFRKGTPRRGLRYSQSAGHELASIGQTPRMAQKVGRRPKLLSVIRRAAATPAANAIMPAECLNRSGIKIRGSASEPTAPLLKENPPRVFQNQRTDSIETQYF